MRSATLLHKMHQLHKLHQLHQLHKLQLSVLRARTGCMRNVIQWRDLKFANCSYSRVDIYIFFLKIC